MQSVSSLGALTEPVTKAPRARVAAAAALVLVGGIVAGWLYNRARTPADQPKAASSKSSRTDPEVSAATPVATIIEQTAPSASAEAQVAPAAVKPEPLPPTPEKSAPSDTTPGSAPPSAEETRTKTPTTSEKTTSRDNQRPAAGKTEQSGSRSTPNSSYKPGGI